MAWDVQMCHYTGEFHPILIHWSSRNSLRILGNLCHLASTESSRFECCLVHFRAREFTSIYTRIYTCQIWILWCLCLCVCIHMNYVICMYTVYMCIYVYTCICICRFVCVCVCMSVYIHGCICTWVWCVCVLYHQPPVSACSCNMIISTSALILRSRNERWDSLSWE